MSDSDVHRFRHHPALGTVVEISVSGAAEHAHRLDALVVAEIGRLERIFSIFDANSELERWKRGEVPEPSEEFRTLMALALQWQIDSRGAFNTASGVISAAWRGSALSGVEPSDAALADLAASVAEPRFRIAEDGRPMPIGDCTPIDLNAIAKGWIVDRATEVAMHDQLDVDIVVNAGGDLLHRGHEPLTVGIENPLRPYDNEPPVATIMLANAGLATSGRARRGVRVADRWHSHVIDPRTARPVDHIASISVVARDAVTADVVATIVGVLDPVDALASTIALDAACLVIDTAGVHQANEAWEALTP